MSKKALVWVVAVFFLVITMSLVNSRQGRAEDETNADPEFSSRSSAVSKICSRASFKMIKGDVQWIKPSRLSTTIGNLECANVPIVIGNELWMNIECEIVEYEVGCCPSVAASMKMIGLVTKSIENDDTIQFAVNDEDCIVGISAKEKGPEGIVSNK